MEIIELLKKEGWEVIEEDTTTRKYGINQTADITFYNLKKDDIGIYIEVGPVDYVIPDMRNDEQD